jgi:hypothetical protein
LKSLFIIERAIAVAALKKAGPQGLIAFNAIEEASRKVSFASNPS